MLRVAISLALVLFCAAVAVSAFGKNPYQKKAGWCGRGLVYLNDRNCLKKYPGSFNRRFTCPVKYTTAPAGYYEHRSLTSVKIDTSALRAIPSAAKVDLLAILIHRTTDGKIYYKYVGSGQATTPFETWSSSKVFSVANGAGNLEKKCRMSLDASVSGKPLGDLVTIITSYDGTKGYTSNGLAKYFATLGGKSRFNGLVTNFLGRRGESLGGSYGESYPNIGFTYSQAGRTCSVSPDEGSAAANYISVLTAAEFVKRITMHRELPANARVPGLKYTDVQNLLYGAAKSALFPGLQWGGMSADCSIFIQAKLNMKSIETRSKGKWRIFNKVGWGYSTSRSRGEVRSNGYSCFPVYGANNKPVVNKGVEFVIAARASVPNDSYQSKAEALIAAAIGDVSKAIVAGKVK